MLTKKIKFIDNMPIHGHKFHEPQDTNPNGFKLFMTSAFIGPPRSGKTLSCINLSKYLQDNNLITEIILISPTSDNNPFHVLNIPEENIISSLEDVENELYRINNYCRNKVEKWKNMKKSITEKKYNDYYNKILKLFKYTNKHPELIYEDDELMLNDEDLEILEDNKFLKRPFYYKVGPSFLLICDDINGSAVISDKKMNPMTQIISNQHNHINLFLLIQNYTKGIPPNVRRLIKQYFLYKFNDVNEIKQFYDEIASSYFNSFDHFKSIYRSITNVQHNFILIDNDPKHDILKVRKNFDELIIFNDNDGPISANPKK